MQDNDFNVFEGKTFSELMKDIYDKSDDKSEKIGGIVDSLKTLIVTIEDAISILPMIKECLDVGVKNDEQLVKMAAVVQRLTTGAKAPTSGGGAFGLGIADHELKELRDNASKELDKVRDEGNVITKDVDAIVRELPIKGPIVLPEDEDPIDYEDEFGDDEDLEDIAANIDEELVEFDELEFEEVEEFSADDLQLKE